MKNIVYNQWGIWNFFNDNKELKCINLSDGEKIDIPEIKCDGFDVTVNEYGVIYGLIQTDADLVIMRYNGRWEKEYIFKDKNCEVYDKKVFIINIENWLNAFYIVKYDEKYLLFHHILGVDAKPQVIFVSKEKLTYSVTVDNQRNIYLFIGVKNLLICKKYIWKNKNWEKDSEKKEYDGEVVNSFGATNKQGEINLVCCVKQKDKYKLCVDDNFTLIDNLNIELNPLLIEDNNIRCVFNYYGKLVESIKNESWGELNYLHTKGFNKNELIKISGNTDFPNGKNFYITYGNIINNKLNQVYGFEKISNTDNEIQSVEKFAESNPIFQVEKEDNDVLIMLEKVKDKLSDAERLLNEIIKFEK